MAKVVAVVRDRANGDVVSGEDVNFRNPGGTILQTVATGADGSAVYEANGNPAGLITWDATVSGDTRKAGARAQRQIGAMFEAELPRSFRSVVGNGYGSGEGDELAVVPGTGRQVVVGTGVYWVNGIPFHFYDDTPLSTSANATLATRKDLVVLRVDFDETSTTYGMGTLAVVEGTVSGVDPTPDADPAGDWEEVLAVVTSAQSFSSYTSGNISDQRDVAGPYAVPVSSLPTGIPATSIADGSVTDAEFQRIGGLTADAQSQINTLSTGLTLKANATHSHAISDVTDLATQLAAKAPAANPTITGTMNAATVNASGKVTASGEVEIDGALNHDGSTVGFYGATPVTKGAALTAVSTATVSATTWGTGEKAVLDSVRDALNDLELRLQALGLIN